MDNILINTDDIKAISTLASDIDTEMQKCVSIISGITEHNDWTCKEKNELNEKLLNVKKGNADFAETASEISTKMAQMASSFEAFEDAIPNKFAFLDKLIGATSSINDCEVSSNVGNVTKNATEVVAENARVTGGMENYVLANTTEPICVCDFSDFYSEEI